MTDETYPDSLPYSVLDSMAREFINAPASRTHAAKMADALAHGADLGYALTDARPWVPTREAFPTGLLPRGVRIREEYTVGGEGDEFVHPDDVPTDPDADLIELIAHGIVSAAVGEGEWDRQTERSRQDWLLAARRALAVVRESEAGA